MSTITEQLIKKQDAGHTVGYFTSIFKPEKLEGGAKCKVDFDNTELGVLYFEDADQEVPYVKRLAKDTDKADVMILSPEILHFDFENKTFFLNGKDTMATVYPLSPAAITKTFKTSSFKAASGKDIANIKRGWYAKYISATDSAKAYYEVSDVKPTAGNVFKVFNTHFEDEYELLGMDMLELEIMGHVEAPVVG